MTIIQIALGYANILQYKGPFTLAIFAAILAAIFAAISSAISNRLSKLLAIQIAAESPVVYTGDLKSP